MIVTHANCADGIASALILHSVLPDRVVRFVQYGSPEWHDLPVTLGAIFADMSPPPEKAQAFIDAGVLVYDHHAHTNAGVKFPGILDTARCGAEIVLDQFAVAKCPAEFQEIARLVGIRDLWKRDSPDWDEACAVQQTLLLYGFPYLSARLDRGCAWLLSDSMTEVGHRLHERAMAFVSDIVRLRKYAVRDRVAYLSCSPEHTSNVGTGILDANPRVDVVAVFNHITHEDAVTYSLRSREGIDIGAICKSLGGGGHPQAAGFKLLTHDYFEGINLIRKAL